MKATCEFVKIDSVGRILVPKSVRKTLGIQTDDNFQIYTDRGNIVLSKIADSCCICGSKKNLCAVKDKFICNSCKGELTK